MKGERKAKKELEVMLNAIKRDQRQLFYGMGKFSCRKKLANGSVVRISITNPPSPKKSAQEQAVEDINAGRTPHNKHTCPGCPIH